MVESLANTGAQQAIGPIALARHAEVPLYRQVHERIRELILRGELAPGARLPSTRGLASQLATARGTVELAYDMLAAEGYIVGRGPRGTVVDPNLALQSFLTRPVVYAQHSQSPLAVVDTATPIEAPAGLTFQMGLPALDVFPTKLWARFAAREVRRFSATQLDYQDSAGYQPLRRAIATYLGMVRGIECTAEQVFITAGFQGALGLVAHVLLQHGDSVWVEDPGYYLARDGLIHAGARVVPVPIDTDGIDVAAGVRRASRARLAVVTPSHQCPLGVTLSLPRRLALLDWAKQAGAWILEDDFDGEFRYDGWPPPALKSLDLAGRVLYVGTFSKVLFPGLRLGYLVVPGDETDRFSLACDVLFPSRALLDQMIVTALIEEGAFARHVRHMRSLYAARRAALVNALIPAVGTHVRIDVQAGGMHVIAWLGEGEDDQAIARRCLKRGLAPGALSSYVVEAGCGPGLLLSFTNVPPEAAGWAAEELRKVLRWPVCRSGL